MKNLIYPLTCLAVLLANSARADDLPFFSSLRAEISSQLTVASNTLPLNKKLITALGANLKLIDRTKTNLIAGSASLGTLAKGLGRTSLSNTFLPILTDTRSVYLDTIETQKGGLEQRLVTTFPGTTRTAANTALNKLAAALDGAKTNTIFTASLTSLSKAAKALATAEKSVIKAETAPPGADFLTATITESNQGVTVFKPLKKTILEASYDPFSGEIDIDAGELKKLTGGRVQVRFLSLSAQVSGEGTHTLSLTNANESYAIYQRGIVFNINAPYPEIESEQNFMTVDPINHRLGTGTLTISVNLDANIVWGDFTFTAKSSEDAALEATMTGSFLLRLQTFE
jgi:hypothetical protein